MRDSCPKCGLKLVLALKRGVVILIEVFKLMNTCMGWRPTTEKLHQKHLHQVPFIWVCVVFANYMTGNVKFGKKHLQVISLAVGWPLDLLTLMKTKRKCFSSYTNVFKITTKHRGAHLLKCNIWSFTFKAWKRQMLISFKK